MNDNNDYFPFDLHTMKREKAGKLLTLIIPSSNITVMIDVLLIQRF